MISIVLPTYNGAKYLAQAIESVLHQTYSQWELLIVDSYSTDDTPHIVARYAAQDSRIHALQHPKEAGRLPGALNAGFAQAQGVYHTWLSDDNEFFPTALEKMCAFLEAHPHLGLVYTDMLVSRAEDSPPQPEIRPPLSVLPGKNTITPSFLYRAALHQQIGGYRIEYFLAEDFDFWLRLLDVAAGARLPEVLHLYRFHEGNLTASAARQAIDDAVERSLLDNLARVGWLQHPYPRAVGYEYLYRLAVRHQRPQDARRYWWLGFRAQPWLLLRRWIFNLLPVAGQQWIGKLLRRRS